MYTLAKIDAAKQFYDAGVALFQENRFPEALEDLKKAENLFRKADVRGHPFRNPLPNGVTGLANAITMSGLCFQKLGDFRRAATYYESSLINAKFEKKRPFRSFLHSVYADLLTCYEKELEGFSTEALKLILAGDPRINPDYRFPFSLTKDAFLLARLYELDPARYSHFHGFYRRAKECDTEIRRRDRKSDEAGMRRMGLYIWGALLAIWAVYGFVVFRSFMQGIK